MGGTERGRTAGCLYRTKELEHALALALSGVRAKIAADCAEGVCLELVPWDLGLSRHREDEVVWGREFGICGRERERTNNGDR